MIVVMQCGYEKSGLHQEALYLYVGQLFRAHRRLAVALRPRDIYIASAQYGLVHAKTVIETYDLKLAQLTPEQRSKWAIDVGRAVDEATAEEEEVVVLAGREYSIWTQHTQRTTVDLLRGLTVCQRRSAVRQLMEAEVVCQDHDRATIRERLRAEHDRMMLEDPDYRATKQRIEEIVASIHELGSPYAERRKPKPADQQIDMFAGSEP